MFAGTRLRTPSMHRYRRTCEGCKGAAARALDDDRAEVVAEVLAVRARAPEARTRAELRNTGHGNLQATQG